MQDEHHSTENSASGGDVAAPVAAPVDAAPVDAPVDVTSTVVAKSKNGTKKDADDKTKKYTKKAGYEDVTQCLICEQEVKRIDRHLKDKHKDLTERELRILKDHLRLRNLHANTKVWWCEPCGRITNNYDSHKRWGKCDMRSVVLLRNFQSKT